MSETKASPTTLDDFRRAYESARENLANVVSKKDFTPDGEIEYLEAQRQLKNAFAAYWFAEAKENRS